MRNGGRQAAALAQARQRRLELDRERDERDLRVEQTTADALMVLDARRDAERALAAVTAELAAAVRALLIEDVSAERAAGLLDVTEVRRLTRSTAADQPTLEAKPAEQQPLRTDPNVSVTGGEPEAGGGDGAARRAG